jgi:hypothetical protein
VSTDSEIGTATFPGINGNMAFQSQVAVGEGVYSHTGDARVFTVGPDGAELIRGTHTVEPTQKRELG